MQVFIFYLNLDKKARFLKSGTWLTVHKTVHVSGQAILLCSLNTFKPVSSEAVGLVDLYQ